MHLKIVSFLIALFSILQLFSQSDYKLAIETQFDVFNRQSNVQPSIKLRYFANENSVLRITFSTNYGNSTQQILQLNGSGVGSIQRIHAMTQFSFGYEHHLSKDKFSPYVGGEILLGGGKTDTYGLRTDSIVFVSSLNYSIKRPVQQFGALIFSGVDIAVFKGLYVGTEIGVLFMQTNYKEGEFRKDDSASLTDATSIEKIPQFSIRNFVIANMGIIRMGWRF
jgi:outer membrane protein W